jgi:hypothetical protein
MNIATVIDPIFNREYQAYATKNMWLPTSDFRYTIGGRIQPVKPKPGDYVTTITLEKMAVPVEAYFGDAIIKPGHPLMVKYQETVWLGIVEQMAQADHYGESVLLHIRLQEVDSLKFVERIDEIVTKTS